MQDQQAFSLWHGAFHASRLRISIQQQVYCHRINFVHTDSVALPLPLQVLTTLQVNSLFYYNRSPVSRALFGGRRIKATLAGAAPPCDVCPPCLCNSWSPASECSSLPSNRGVMPPVHRCPRNLLATAARNTDPARVQPGTQAVVNTRRSPELLMCITPCVA